MSENIFEYVDLSGEVPPGICQRCSELAMEHLPSGTRFAFCEHAAVGGMLIPGSEWYLVENVSAADFQTAVLVACLEGEALYIDQQTDRLTSQ